MEQEKDTLEEVKAILKQFALDMQLLKVSQIETDKKFQDTERIIKEAQLETERIIKEAQLETDRQFKETDRQFKETDRQFKKTDRQFKETDRQFKETKEFIAETSKMVKETTRQIREHGLQIGGIHNSFGKFTEELFFSSLQIELFHKFKLQFFDTNVTRNSKNDNFEADAIAFSNGTANSLYLVEIKSHFTKTALKQLTKKIGDINKFCPEHISKKKYGVIAVPYLKSTQLQEILKAGFYPATLKGDLLVIENPKNFKPKEF